MLGYLTTQKLTLKNQNQIKIVTAAQSLAEAALKDIQLEAAEFDLALEEVKNILGDSWNKEPCIRITQDTEIAAWDQFPPRLGRISMGLYETQTESNHENELNPLLEQIRILKARSPQKQHYRFALVNGFGGNLGDTLVGVTAFKQLVKVLEQELTDFCFDILHGWLTNTACRDLIANEPYVGHVYHRGLTLAQFGVYDAHFDVSGLISYSRFDSLPPVDWYLWWFGLEPSQIQSINKRNHYAVPYSYWHQVDIILRSTKARRIYFGHKASVPLRSIPIKQAKRIALELANQLPDDCVLIIDQPINIQHSKILDLSGKIDNVEKFKSLISLVDQVITIDSFALHLADAAAKPTVLLSAVLELERYKYYPTVVGTLIPGATDLPCWKKMKTKDQAEWEAVEPTYYDAWKKVRGTDILLSLDQAIHATQVNTRALTVNFSFADTIGHKSFNCIKSYGANINSYYWNNRRKSSFISKIDTLVTAHGKSVVRSGSTVVHAGPADFSAPVSLAESMYPFGEYYIFEPRRLYAQTQAANFIASGLNSLFLNQYCPFESADSSVDINDLDPYSETNPLGLGNTFESQKVKCFKLDSLDILACQLLIIQKPLPFNLVLQGALNFIKNHMPYIIMLPMTHAEAHEACILLKDLDYQFYAEDMGQDETNEPNIAVIAIPNSADAVITGLIKINLQ